MPIVVEILMAAGTEVTDDIKTLLNRGEGANVRDYSSRGMTELITASADGRIDDVRILLKKGADVNEGDDNGLTSLHHWFSRRPYRYCQDPYRSRCKRERER